MDSWDLYEPADILAKLPSTFETNLESKKWTERKEAIESLLQLLTDNPRLATNVHYDEIISTLTRVLEKDANINVTSLAAKCLTGFAKGLRKKFEKFAPTTAKVVFEKFKEKKPLLRDPLIELIDALYATTTLGALNDEVLEAAGKPNPNIKLQLDQFLYRVFRHLKAKDVPKPLLKQLVPVLVKHTGEPDPEVRDAGCAALGAVMKCIGPQAATVLLGGAFTGDKAKMAKVEEFCAKAIDEAKAVEEEQAKESSSERAAGGGSSSARSAAAGKADDVVSDDEDAAAESAAPEVDPWELLEPVDIVPLIARDFYTVLESKKWLERKGALDGVHQLLVDNSRLTAKGNINDLVKALSTILSDDANINVAASAAKCITGLATGLRRDFNQHAKPIVPIVLAKFKEKKPTLRDPLIACIDALFAATSLEAMGDDLIEAANKPNPDIKIQVDQFLYRAFLHADVKAIPKKWLKDLTPILVKHAADSSPDVRNASYAALGSIMKCIGQKAVPVLFGDLTGDKTKMSKVEEAYNKAMAEAPPPAACKSVEKPETKQQDKKLVVKPVQKPAKSEDVEEDNEEKEKNEPPKLKKAADAEEKKGAAKAKADSAGAAKQQEEKEKEAESCLLKVNSNRAGRAKEEKAHKILKWNFDAPTAEHTEQLNALLTEAAKPELCAQLISKDFKHHIKAIDSLQQILNTEPLAIVNNIDLLLKWSTLRFFDTNPAVLIRLLEFLCSTFAYMEAQNENITDVEMTSFVPYLLLKSGDAKDVIRNNVRKIIKQLGGLSVPGKIFPLILDGFKTKNSRQKTECIVITDLFLECMGVNITSTPQTTMKVLAACISDRDSSVRNAALNAVVTVYKKIGDRVFSLIGQLNEKERAMLDERIKRSRRFVNGGPDTDRPATTRDSSQTRLNNTFFETPNRARSSSATRRSLNAASTPTMVAGDTEIDTTTVKKSASRQRQSMGILPSAGGGAPSKFQLDPKFFANDFDALNTTRTVDGSEGVGAALDAAENVDLNMIQPVVRPTTSGRFPKRSESVSSISSLESAEQIDRTVHNLSCLSLSIADEAIAQLLHLLHDPVNKAYVVERSELILKTFITQFFHIRSQHLEQLGSGINENELGEFMRSVCNFLSSLVKDDAIIGKISADTMRAFVDALLCLVSDLRLNGLPGSRQIYRSLNVVVIRLCEFSNPNSCFVALMKLLIKYQATDPDSRIIGLVRKCLFKHVDVFLDPAKHELLDLSAIFDLLYAYYSKFYVDPTSESVKETCRTLHVYIQRLVVTKRYKVLNYLYPYPENSQLVLYVRRCVRALGKSELGKDTTTVNSTIDQSMVNSTAITTSVNKVPEELTNLFKRIKEDIFDGCVEELYNFMDVHPEQNGNFEELMTTCDFGCIILRAFTELRQSRMAKHPMATGECVKRVLPDDDRTFIEQQYELQTKMDDAIRAFAGTSAAAK